MATVNDTAVNNRTDEPHSANDYTDLLQTDHHDAFAFSDQEQFALQLYDQLRELELQNSLYQAQTNGKF